jgi:hypothetical protein
MAQQIYQGAHPHNHAIPVAYLRCGGAILNSGNLLADVVKNEAVLVACAPEDEPATTSNSTCSSNMPFSFGRPALRELLQGVEPGGQINRDGRNAVRDRTAESNSHPHKYVLRQQKPSQANKATLD